MSVTRNTPSLVAASVLVLSGAASADIVTGRVVDANGIGIPTVNIDIENLGGGGDPDISDDITDALGNFTVIVPPGLYDVIFLPPKPPTTTHLGTVVASVPIVGTVNLGDIVLEAGYGFYGRVVDPAGFPLPGIDADIKDLTTGLESLGAGDNTDALGQFALAVPQGPFELDFDATGVVGQTLVSYGAVYDLSGDTNVGDIFLEPGALVTGQVVGPGGSPVANADIDLARSDGTKIVTHKDNTNGSGVFTVTAPFDVVDVMVCPPAAAPLAGKAVVGLNVTGTTSVGVVSLQAGVVLSGNVTTFAGQPASGADVDLVVSGTGASIFICGDSVKADGSYSFKAPAGAYDVVFEPASFDVPLGSTTIAGVTLAGPQVVDGVLPSCPFPLEFGVGKPGSGGFVPDLSTFGGVARADNSGFGFSIDGLAGGAPGALAIGFQQLALPLFGGTVYLNPGGPLFSFPFVASGPAGAPGVGSAGIPVPVQTSYVGIFIVGQAWAIDFGLPDFLTLSDAVSTTFCP